MPIPIPKPTPPLILPSASGYSVLADGRPERLCHTHADAIAYARETYEADMAVWRGRVAALSSPSTDEKPKA